MWMPRSFRSLLVVALAATTPALVVSASPVQADASSLVQIDFGTSSMTPVDGYLLDFGEPYGARTGADQGSGTTYGWVLDGTDTPLDLTGAGRRRYGTGVTDARATTLMHMQGVAETPGMWELAVPDGVYAVTVGVGDALGVYDSTHAVSVEGQQAVEPYEPGPTTRLREGSVTVLVEDGRLTVRPTNGVNTKITYLTVEETEALPDPTLPLKIDFGATSSTPAEEHELDAGAPYGTQAGNVYGWVEDGTHVPLDLTGNGRQRSTNWVSDARLASFVHVQYPGSSGGVGTPGAWELALGEGTYRVTVAVGDAANNYDSEHAITVEDVELVAPFTPTGAHKFEVATADVEVTDGRLTVRALGGSNTKIDYLEVAAWTEPTTPTFPLKVDFGAMTSPVASGYVLDYGAAFGARNDGHAFGWVREDDGEPLDLSANGRQRSGSAVTTTDVRLKSLVHMQYPGGSSGDSTPGSWELAVPNGTYKLTVAVGDASPSYDSEHAIAVEGLQLIQPFSPTPAHRFATATTVLSVTDGRLTVAPSGGTNTKIDYIDVDEVDTTRPRLLSVTPGDGDVDVPRDSSITGEVYLPNGAIAPATVTSETVRLIDVATEEQVPGDVNTSGGGDVVVLTPSAPLDADTEYRFEITDGVQDVEGAAFLEHASTFTTGELLSGNGIPGVAFEQVANPATDGNLFTSVAIGPDHKLYAGSILGTIYRYTIAADGTLGDQETISTVRDLNSGADRTVVGLAFDPASTAEDPVLWVTENAPYLGVNNVADWSSAVARLTGPDLEDGEKVLVSLPRSAHDHQANSLAFGPDGALYLAMGSNTGMGYPDVAWGNRPESLLAGAILRIDPDLLPATLPLDVRPPDGGGTYDPFAAGAAVTLYATGVRNAFDLLWHSNGRLYAPTNGSAAGANIPGVPSVLPAECATTRPDLAENGPWTYEGPTVNTILGNPNPQTDFIHTITEGGYYGHPNPTRCEYISYGGNPTQYQDPWQEPSYPIGVEPDRNFRADEVYDAGLHASADGIIEYRGDAFGGALEGRLLVVRYSAGKDIMVVDPGGADGALTGTTLGVTGFTGFDEPLDLIEDATTGNLYVTELGGATITLLRPAA